METIDQKLSNSGKTSFAQVEKNEKTIITNKNGKFSPKVYQTNNFNFYVIRSGYYLITAQEDKITIAKVVSFSEADNGETKEKIAVCKIIQQKENGKWNAIPPKSLERAIKKIENP